MKYRAIFSLILITFTFLLISLPGIPALSQQAVVIPVQGTIERGLAAFIIRSIEQHKNDPDVAVFILNMDTPGGRVDAALEISNALLSSPKPVITFVNKQAISAGALISLSCPKIAMAPGGTLGDVEPQPTTEKNVSFLKAKMRSLAQRFNRNPDIAAAMVDASLAIPGIVEEGKLLTFTTQEALKAGFTDIEASDIPELLSKADYKDITIITEEFSLAEIVARFITHPVISSFLLTLGFLGILFELKVPGWGISGTIGIICILLFFGGHMIAGFAGFEAIAAFIGGIILIVLELFVVPGFGVTGVGGIALILLSIYLALGSFTQAILIVAPAVLSSSLILLYLIFTLHDSWLARKLSLQFSESQSTGFTSSEDTGTSIGEEGIALSTLRPSGRASIRGQDLNVLAEGRFIEKGQKIRVSRISGNNIYVRSID